MKTPASPDSNYLSVLERVHQLGSATESLFSRLYRGLNKRRQLGEEEKEALMQQITGNMIVRNRQLRNMLKEREIEAERLAGILEQVSEGFIMQDNEGRIVLMNRVAHDLLGNQGNFWSSELGLLFSEKRNLPTFDSELAPLGEAKRVQIGSRVISAQIMAIADKQGARLGTLMVLRDVTREELANRMKNSFVTHISHELITPLAPMRVASEILLNTPQDKAPNRKMLEMIGRNIDILDRMVSEMLDMSAMTSGNFQVEHEAITVEDLLWQVVQSFKADLDDKQLEMMMMLRDTAGLQVTGDKKYLQWAVTNLIRNAIQYNQAGERVIIRAGIKRENIVIEFKDTGVGIAPSDLPFIFNLFYRGDARTLDGKKIDPRGLGQGLFVVRKVAEAHGGTISVRSEVGKGSTFTLKLPRNISA